MRAQHGNVVGDGLGVGRTHADVHQGDAGMVAAHQVVRGHLRQARGLPLIARAAFPAARDAVAGLDQHVVVLVAAGHQRAGTGAKLVHIELVVGEQHEILEVRRRGRGVVLQAVQGIIHALGGKRRQRLGFALLAAPRAVDDGVVGHGQVRHVEQVTQRALERLQVLALDIGAFRKREMQRNGGIGFADFDRHAVVLQQLADLLDQMPGSATWP
ncbi:hypothetical protein G6F31_017789 [Rhizopus arrhizus]|nr:hypothetical protein G6F31_017789 [Rhizopus arrhizus]